MAAPQLLSNNRRSGRLVSWISPAMEILHCFYSISAECLLQVPFYCIFQITRFSFHRLTTKFPAGIALKDSRTQHYLPCPKIQRPSVKSCSCVVQLKLFALLESLDPIRGFLGEGAEGQMKGLPSELTSKADFVWVCIVTNAFKSILGEYF